MYNIDSNLYDLRCKKEPSHFGEVLKGYCFDCHEHYCSKCEDEHISDFHTTTEINKMLIENNEIDNIKKQNKEYRSLISYYESLIRLNNLILNAYEKYRDNYYNLYNINIIAKNFKRKDLLNEFCKEDKLIEAGDKSVNHFKYINELYKLQLKEEEADRIELENKFFNNYDFKVLCQLPLKNLRLLVLENNGISDISCLENAEFPLLVALNLNNNAISDISVLDKIKFVDIEALLMRNNNIKDIKVFGKIKYETLRAVDLRDNKIEDITPFENHQLQMLQCLYLKGNNFGDINEQKYSSTKQKLTSLIEFDLVEPAE
jgi:Leucine-rich repeat (LRR) protein